MLKVAVIGMGRFGQHHARIYQEIPEVDMVASCDILADHGVYDPEPSYRQYTSYEALLDNECPDIVSVAVPTESHFEVVLGCLARDVDVLVEKPLASTIGQAGLLMGIAKEKELILAVGHVERFNPIITELKRVIDFLGMPEYIETYRSGPRPTRRQQDCIALELAIHDIDVIRYLVGDIEFKGACMTQSGFRGTYGLSHNGQASVSAHYGAPKRTISVQFDEWWFFGDYLAKTIKVRRGSEISLVSLSGPEPLYLELQEFVDVANGGVFRVLATAEDGLAAMRLV